MLLALAALVASATHLLLAPLALNLILTLTLTLTLPS